MTEITGLSGKEVQELHDRKALLHCTQQRFEALGFNVNDMEGREWIPGLTFKGFKLTKTSESYEPSSSITTEIIFNETSLIVRKTQAFPDLTKTVEITEDLSPKGEFQGVRLVLRKEPKHETNKEEIILTWNPDGTLDKERCTLQKGLGGAEKLSVAGMLEKFRESLEGPWRFTRGVIEGKIKTEPEQLLARTLKQTETDPKDFFSPAIVLFL